MSAISLNTILQCPPRPTSYWRVLLVSWISIFSITRRNWNFFSHKGFIGGTVFHRLVNHPDFNSSFVLTLLIRSSDKAEKFRKHFRAGVSAVVGSYDDSALVESLAAQSDVIIATVSGSLCGWLRVNFWWMAPLGEWHIKAHADHVEGAVATLAGLRKRYQATGVAPVFIHTVSSMLPASVNESLIGLY